MVNGTKYESLDEIISAINELCAKVEALEEIIDELVYKLGDM